MQRKIPEDIWQLPASASRQGKGLNKEVMASASSSIWEKAAPSSLCPEVRQLSSSPYISGVFGAVAPAGAQGKQFHQWLWLTENVAVQRYTSTTIASQGHILTKEELLSCPNVEELGAVFWSSESSSSPLTYQCSLYIQSCFRSYGWAKTLCRMDMGESWRPNTKKIVMGLR